MQRSKLQWWWDMACGKQCYRAAHRGVQAQGGERQAADEARRLRWDAEAAGDEAEGGEARQRRQGRHHRVQRPGRVRRVGEPLQLRAAGQQGAGASASAAGEFHPSASVLGGTAACWRPAVCSNDGQEKRGRTFQWWQTVS